VCLRIHEEVRVKRLARVKEVQVHEMKEQAQVYEVGRAQMHEIGWVWVHEMGWVQVCAKRQEGRDTRQSSETQQLCETQQLRGHEAEEVAAHEQEQA
jgi:hypothetical protein